MHCPHRAPSLGALLTPRTVCGTGMKDELVKIMTDLRTQSMRGHAGATPAPHAHHTRHNSIRG